MNLKIKYLQVHIPQNFEDEIIKSVRAFPNSMFSQKDEIKGRRIIMNYLGRGYPINSIERKL